MVHFESMTSTCDAASKAAGKAWALGDGHKNAASQTTSFVGRAFAGNPSYCVQMTPDNIPDLLRQGPAFKSQTSWRATSGCALAIGRQRVIGKERRRLSGVVRRGR